jgi:hypothetical protein
MQDSNMTRSALTICSARQTYTFYLCNVAALNCASIGLWSFLFVTIAHNCTQRIRPVIYYFEQFLRYSNFLTYPIRCDAYQALAFSVCFIFVIVYESQNFHLLLASTYYSSFTVLLVFTCVKLVPNPL